MNQLPEKLVNLLIKKVVEGKPLPLFCYGQVTREWLSFVNHARVLYFVVHEAEKGKAYNIDGFKECADIDYIQLLFSRIDEKLVWDKINAEVLITFIKDHGGHDYRYSNDATKINNELGWAPIITFEEG